MKLTGHKVLVTGGSAGIGFELAREFVARSKVCGRDLQKLAKARDALGEVETVKPIWRFPVKRLHLPKRLQPD